MHGVAFAEPGVLEYTFFMLALGSTGVVVLHLVFKSLEGVGWDAVRGDDLKRKILLTVVLWTVLGGFHQWAISKPHPPSLALVVAVLGVVAFAAFAEWAHSNPEVLEE